jgi:ribosomal protein S3
MENVMKSGALGVELVISGKIPSSRAKSWRFYQGYLKKCGDLSVNGVRKAQASALLKTGIIGVKVAIMPPDLKLPDHITILSEPQQIVEEIKEAKPKRASPSNNKEGAAKAKKPKPKKEGAARPSKKNDASAKVESKVETGSDNADANANKDAENSEE